MATNMAPGGTPSASTTHGRTAAHGRPTSGWLTFAGLVAVVLGGFNVIDGLVALLKPTYYLVTEERVLLFNFTAWGWIWLIVGIVQLAVGAGILAGQTWARAAGIGLAVLAAFGHLVFLTAYPVWSVMAIALCVLLMYALTRPAHDSVAA
ncbi:DUF7144 family membrane protein [Actinomadura parmotrematis]|uniref:DUF7144 domain-containing protein n=1 Tax=Actinomadura parmotrematis TaxID=2864039 RepID=A0ABS7FNE9_9ACTN|nr:hypothetical protein [Actinomadura parmotrematis]MBW8481881.1 hypothetical protein [Actinomadura parmotrematis]